MPVRSLLLLLFGAVRIAAGQSLALSETDSVRVWVFEGQSLTGLTIGVHSGEAFVTSGNDTLFDLRPGDDPLHLSTFDGRVVIDRKRDQSVKKLRVHAVASSLFWVADGSKKLFLRGDLLAEPKGRNASLRVINHVSMEDYVTSVIAGEMPFEEQEALKSQAVIARTYALWNMALAKKGDFDVTDHTASQVYIGEPVTKPWVRLAAEATTGEVLTWSGRLILSAYFSTSGGTTTGNESVWQGKPLPYLRPINDGDASMASPHYAWRFAISRKALHEAFRSSFPRSENDVRIVEKDASGRVTKLQLGTKNWTGQDFRLKVIRSFGPKSLKSTLFDITTSPDSVVFSGRGMGHGVGLSQWGAYGLARSGWSYVEILKFYYSGVEVSNIHHFPNDRIELAQ